MAPELEFNVQLDSPIAVYVQVKNIVQFAIASGDLGPGATLPSVRILSKKLNINPNTVTKAFRDLEMMGLVVTRRGVGVAITENATSICRESIKELVTDHLKGAVAECIAAGLSAKEIRQIVKETIDQKPKPYTSSSS